MTIGVHTYRKTKELGGWLYTVGYYRYHPHTVGGEVIDYQWESIEDTSDEGEARALVNYLNGGQGYLFRYATEK